ncbi:MAG TPA: tetratricopeptide repeat protein, partial [Chroococcales cyanobacterium]
MANMRLKLPYTWRHSTIWSVRTIAILLAAVAAQWTGLQLQPQPALAAPPPGQAEINQGRELERHKQYSEALASYTKAIKASSKNPDYYYRRANCYLLIKDFPRAIQDCDSVLKLDPHHVLALRCRAFAHLELNHLQEGIDDYDAVLELNPRDNEAKRNRATAIKLLATHDPAHASPETLRSYTRDQIAAADRLLKNKHPVQALPIINRMLRTEPQNATLYFQRAQANLMLDQPQEALPDLKKSAELNPKNIDVWYQL